ncbi:MAG: bifunctional 4-hydroxy-2-oxoglutarate aldolase/2-dehydro-3-deoxy-phosphogluconate aldolase, partial [Sphaerochaetaceae bacterium]|nr:bifunctional 4-hydroxy-2-oxoglutarate aldolase/2-dehydro-3-deoxy-phosphogluconate aldolase [Sphaerochaetaceae bacterium]
MDIVSKRLARVRCIPMIKLVSLAHASSLGEALIAGGLPVANISQQTNEGLELLCLLAAKFPDLLVGGGNVQTVGQARNAIEAGARFIFSPIFDLDIITLCQQQGVAVYPVTKEGLLAVENNLGVLGFYPVEKLGGLKAIDKLG